MSSQEAKDRHGCPEGVFGSRTWDVLVRGGFVSHSGRNYYLTDAGRQVHMERGES